MKTYLIVLLIFVFLFCLGGLTVYIEAKKESDLKQSEIDGLKKSNKEEADRLRSELALTRDTLLLARQTIILQADTIEADKKEKENYKRNTHDKIKFIPYANDSQRDSVLSGLYPSFRSFR